MAVNITFTVVDGRALTLSRVPQSTLWTLKVIEKTIYSVHKKGWLLDALLLVSHCW